MGFHCCKDLELYVPGDERIKGQVFFPGFYKAHYKAYSCHGILKK